MSRYDALGQHLAAADVPDMLLSFGDIEVIIKRRLPASARNYRAWWANDQTGHSQSRAGWLDAGWVVEGVNFETETVHFHRVRRPSALAPIQPGDWPAVRTDDPARFLDDATDVMTDYFGSRDAGENMPLFEKRRVGSIPREFDLVSEDGLKVGQTKITTVGDGGRVASSKLASISELVWLLQRVPARERFVVFGRDHRVAQAWLNRYHEHVEDVVFYFLRESREVVVLERRIDQPEIEIVE